MRSAKASETRTFYFTDSAGVEYRRHNGQHSFGEPRSESALAAELAQEFKVPRKAKAKRLSLSASDYLVFAVFARDVQAKPESSDGDEDPMSLDEVLAYFAEPETRYVPTPSDKSWSRSVEQLCERGILVSTEDGFTLDVSLHPLARELVADRQYTIMRFDFLDDQWLVREVSLYPTGDSVFRIGAQPDGSVVIPEALRGYTGFDIIEP